MSDILVNFSFWILASGFFALLILFLYFMVTIYRISLSQSIRPTGIEISIVVFLVGLFVAALSLTAYEAQSALSKMRYIVSQNDVIIFVDGKAMKGNIRQQFVEDVSHLHQHKVSGSEPTVSYDVVLEHNDDKSTFIFKRDSLNKHMYWVYSAHFPFAGDIGYISTGALDNFVGRPHLTKGQGAD